MNNLTNSLLLEVYRFLDIYSLIRIYKLGLINKFTENEKKFFFKLIWKLVLINIKHYENIYKPWKYNIQYGKFIYYFPAYNKIVPVYIDHLKWIKIFLLR